jgi:hypothetical protein
VTEGSEGRKDGRVNGEKRIKETHFETLLGFTAAREQKTEDGSPSPVSFSVSSVFTAENLRLLK